MLVVLKMYKTHVLFPKGEAAPSHISYARNAWAAILQIAFLFFDV